MDQKLRSLSSHFAKLNVNVKFYPQTSFDENFQLVQNKKKDNKNLACKSGCISCSKNCCQMFWIRHRPFRGEWPKRYDNRKVYHPAGPSLLPGHFAHLFRPKVHCCYSFSAVQRDREGQYVAGGQSLILHFPCLHFDLPAPHRRVDQFPDSPDPQNLEGAEPGFGYRFFRFQPGLDGQPVPCRGGIEPGCLH